MAPLLVLGPIRSKRNYYIVEFRSAGLSTGRMIFNASDGALGYTAGLRPGQAALNRFAMPAELPALVENYEVTFDDRTTIRLNPAVFSVDVTWCGPPATNHIRLCSRSTSSARRSVSCLFVWMPRCTQADPHRRRGVTAELLKNSTRPERPQTRSPFRYCRSQRRRLRLYDARELSMADEPSLLSDEPTLDLLEKAKGGDRVAVEALLHGACPSLKRWAHGRLPGYARGELDTGDLVQEAALHLLKRLDKFQPQHVGAMQAYLRLSVINRIRDQIRKTSRQPAPEELPEEITSDRTSPLGDGDPDRSLRALPRCAHRTGIEGLGAGRCAHRGAVERRGNRRPLRPANDRCCSNGGTLGGAASHPVMNRQRRVHPDRSRQAHERRRPIEPREAGQAKPKSVEGRSRSSAAR